MQFGMPTLIETKTLYECAELCRELGLSFIEINMNLPDYQADTLDVNHLRDVAGEYGIYYTLHIDENLNPFDFNKWVAKAYMDTILWSVELARQLSAPILNMHLHPGVWFTLPDRKVFLFEEYEHEYLQKLKALRDECTADVGKRNIKICVENCGDYKDKPYIRKGLDLLLESPVFALTFDIGHNAGAGYADELTIMNRADRLCHFHIHDAKGKANHLILGEGDMDLPKYLDLAKTHDCRAVLEVKTAEGLRRSVAWLKERGYV